MLLVDEWRMLLEASTSASLEVSREGAEFTDVSRRGLGGEVVPAKAPASHKPVAFQYTCALKCIFHLVFATIEI